MAYVQEEGIELTDEQLESVAGGAQTWMGLEICPNCGADNPGQWGVPNCTVMRYTCNKCGYTWVNEVLVDGPEVTGHK